MRHFVPIILFVFLFVSPADSWADKSYKVVVFGDSITGGYQLQPQDAFPARLERKLKLSGYDRIEVINMSKNDATTASASGETEKVVQALPDVIIVQLGYNDAKRGVLSTATAYNLGVIITQLKPTGAYIILAGIPAPEGVAESYHDEIVNNFYKVATEQKVPLVQNILDGIANNPTVTLADGRHPNTVGVEMMVESLFPAVDTGLRWRYEIFTQQLEEANKTQAPGLPPVQP